MFRVLKFLERQLRRDPGDPGPTGNVVAGWVVAGLHCWRPDVAHLRVCLQSVFCDVLESRVVRTQKPEALAWNPDPRIPGVWVDPCIAPELLSLCIELGPEPAA